MFFIPFDTPDLIVLVFRLPSIHLYLDPLGQVGNHSQSTHVVVSSLLEVWEVGPRMTVRRKRWSQERTGPEYRLGSLGSVGRQTGGV